MQIVQCISHLQCYSFDFEGTTLTNGELDEKINIQLNEHKQLLDEQQKEKVEKDHLSLFLLHIFFLLLPFLVPSVFVFPSFLVPHTPFVVPVFPPPNDLFLLFHQNIE
jgi:polyferredoxin